MTTTLITGANKGLGLETARRLLRAGHTVYAGMRDTANGTDAAALGAHVLQLDVTDDESVASAIASLPELDVLINNAGIVGSHAGVDEFGADDLAAVFDTNVYSIVRVTRAALPLLRASGNARIVNVASGLGFPRFVTDPARVESTITGLGYMTSKAAVIMLTLQYSKMLPSMRVNTIDPGYTSTDLNGHSGPQTVSEGTDAAVAMATIGHDGPTGTFSDRDGLIAY
ncbi:SDR family NAD(P)-dependent oxidoreductase [Cryobacterium sp. MDB1-18-2]|uniref:SDR family NAD(P)-dependent oxidoreductase n=1 Tax=Cryobacterium glucosi TaxID=1259175 RepID=A0ABY2ILN0_9MICO|nr:MULTISPECIES: SDR family NAD(P)-dependent oxidoreductase [Cryobacterium]TFC17283.1 SDR family NAD(P)-dependent oxidoreductase [Cryobacterium glucosi]TFC33783.1 SDR family NAD(P)-dependent oxidoreductase [Cryobacterium sp. MDB1-18-2]TFC40754.1 SDR family NAD(P)-dependent oxidoreductase [Cryobacterium sp. MDB1-18-1]